MRQIKHRGMTAVLCVLVAVAGLVAQDKMGDMKAMKGIQGSFLRQSMMVEQQFSSLLNAMPEETFNWRPMDGVRSVAEAYLHAAAGNYITLKTMGGTLPEGVNLMTLEKSTTDRAKIADELKRSFKAVNDYVAAIQNSDLDRQVDFFGRSLTVSDMVMAAANHQHELLGQAISYARMNKVVPPWTEARQQKMKEGTNK